MNHNNSSYDNIFKSYCWELSVVVLSLIRFLSSCLVFSTSLKVNSSSSNNDINWLIIVSWEEFNSDMLINAPFLFWLTGILFFIIYFKNFSWLDKGMFSKYFLISFNDDIILIIIII